MVGLSEFSLIEKYFSAQAQHCINENTVLGIGDDAAVINVPQGHQLVVTIDTLVAGRHFPVDTSPFDIGYKSLAVNVSDLVAMAATPSFFLLSLTIPQADEYFLHAFAQGLFKAAAEFGLSLVGGDTCKGPLSISIQASGFIPANQFVTRSGASIGDRILVSGKLGAAALGLAYVQNRVQLSDEQKKLCMRALERPQPRLDLIDMLRDYATAAIDLSDGLVGDLAHIVKNSAVGAVIYRQKIPAYEGLYEHKLFDYALTGGDDYQILFTVAQTDMKDLMASASQFRLDLFDIGEITDKGYVMMDKNETIDLLTYRGFDHFAA